MSASDSASASAGTTSSTTRWARTFTLAANASTSRSACCAVSGRNRSSVLTGTFDRIDRAALNPRPRRMIPIWLSGFVDAALRRAAALGDGFIFADGAVDAFEQVARLRQYLQEAERPEAGFGLHCNMLRAKTPQAVVETVFALARCRWHARRRSPRWARTLRRSISTSTI